MTSTSSSHPKLFSSFLLTATILTVARKAWTALASVVNEDGKVGWSQPAGGGPGKVAKANTSKFGTGIFLLAASEIHLLFANEGNKQ